MFCCTLLCVHSSIAIILMGKSPGGQIFVECFVQGDLIWHGKFDPVNQGGKSQMRCFVYGGLYGMFFPGRQIRVG